MFYTHFCLLKLIKYFPKMISSQSPNMCRELHVTLLKTQFFEQSCEFSQQRDVGV